MLPAFSSRNCNQVKRVFPPRESFFTERCPTSKATRLRPPPSEVRRVQTEGQPYAWAEGKCRRLLFDVDHSCS
jgi:hypothetical protein